MKIQKGVFALAGTVAMVASAVMPASATGFSVSADKSTNLVVAGDTVTVTLTGVPADQGVYVRLCKGTLAEATQARPIQCFGQGAWVSMSTAQQGFGAGNAGAPVALAVQARFDTVDCTVDACGIHIRRDHNGGSNDYSLDRFIPVTFAPVTAQAPVAQNGLTRAKGKVTFRIVNKNGKTVTLVVGSRKIVKKITSDDFTVSVSAPAKGAFKAEASVGGAKLLSKRYSK